MPFFEIDQRKVGYYCEWAVFIALNIGALGLAKLKSMGVIKPAIFIDGDPYYAEADVKRAKAVMRRKFNAKFPRQSKGKRAQVVRLASRSRCE